jgi:plastocyanin
MARWSRIVGSSLRRRNSMKRLRFVLVAALGALVLVGAGCGSDDEDADDTTTITETTDTTTETTEAGGALKGTVGPGFDISLQTEDGAAVSTLPAGSYELEIEDLSSIHNFHLTGPAVDISTDVGEEGTQNVPLELQPGTYTFVCDPHAAQMNGSFEVS